MPAQLSQTVDVETPELVVLTYTVAGVGSRALAALIDYLICVAAMIIGIIGLTQFDRLPGQSKDASGAWVLAALGIFQFAILWLYYVLFEALADGQTPGKRVMHLRVVRDGGLAINFESSAVRNLVRIVDMQPAFFYAVGLTSLVVNSRGKRLGDLAAGTLVVREALIHQAIESAPIRTERNALPLSLSARLSENEYALLDRFVQRRMEFDADRRLALARGLVERLRAALGEDADKAPINALVRLHEDERSARARGVASRNEVGAARERHAIVAINSPRWRAFATRLEGLRGQGLKSLDEKGVREFVQEYRELASDLARLRTATRGTDSSELFFLNRLVATAHSLLYRRRVLTLSGIVQFLFAEVPAEVRRSFRPIMLAVALLFVPVAIAATAVVTKPALIPTLLSPGMIARADSGVQNAKVGKGYIDDPELFRPIMASRVMTNNVQVTFGAFAFGITAGIMTVWVLVTNGISIGSVIGLYLSKHIGHLVFGFMAPHGVLELTAIVIAGGAGFLLAAALLIPGQRTRRRALVENGRRAIRLIAASTFLLVFAGAIEGFISPNASISLAGKFAFSGATAVLLLAYLRPWASWLSTRRPDSSVPDTDSPRSLSSLSAIRPTQ